MTTAEQCTRLRRTRGYTQEGWAAALGVSQATVSRWETGRRMPGVLMLAAMERLPRVRAAARRGPYHRERRPNYSECA